MFIRFVSSEIDERSHVAAGLFCAAAKLRRASDLPEHEWETLSDVWDWFNDRLKSPVEQLERGTKYHRAVCWFKPTAHEYLGRAWDLVTILERNGVFIRMIKSRKIGYILYEDEAQVFAEPYADIRRICRR